MSWDSKEPLEAPWATQPPRGSFENPHWAAPTPSHLLSPPTTTKWVREFWGVFWKVCTRRMEIECMLACWILRLQSFPPLTHTPTKVTAVPPWCIWPAWGHRPCRPGQWEQSLRQFCSASLSAVRETYPLAWKTETECYRRDSENQRAERKTRNTVTDNLGPRREWSFFNKKKKRDIQRTRTFDTW